MNTQNKKRQALLVVSILVLTAIFTSGCYDLGPWLGHASHSVNVAINEDMFYHGEPHFTINGHEIWEGMLDEVDRLEMHDGYMRFIGTCQQPDGSVVDGSIDLSLGAENGGLVARIIAVNIPGLTLDDPLVVMANHDLEVSLSTDDFGAGADVYFQDVRVTEDGLQIEVKVDVNF
jgi:hypothetical protein